jgi:hypothetical protein
LKRDLYRQTADSSTAVNLVIELSGSELSVVAIDSNNALQGYSFFSTSFKLSENDFYASLEKELSKVKEEYHKIVKVKLFLDNNRVSFIPEKFYQSTDAPQHFTLQHGHSPEPSLLRETDIVKKAVGIFEYSKQLEELVIKVFGSCALFHSYAAQATDSFASEAISIIFHKHYFNLCIKKEGQLQIVRSFSFETEADVLYHILNSFQLLDIEVEGTTVGLCGAIDKSSSLYKTLDEFLFDLQLMKTDIEISDDEAPAHYFYHLLQFDKCVS